jgi:hypothetical protein
MLKDSALGHVYFDISWDEVAKYAVATPESIKTVADLINRHPDRFLFGTDEVAPSSQEKYLKVYHPYAPLWSLLDKETSEKVRKGNYARIFDEARRKVRIWERAHVNTASAQCAANPLASDRPLFQGGTPKTPVVPLFKRNGLPAGRAIHSHLQMAKVEPRPHATAGESFERSQKTQISSNSNDSRHPSGAGRPPWRRDRCRCPLPVFLQFFSFGKPANCTGRTSCTASG